MTEVPRRLRWVSSLLALRPGERVLEIGCGGGHLLALLAEEHPTTTIIGIDRSSLQARNATRRLRRIVSPPEVLALALEDAPAHFAGECFSRIVAMNVNLFWTQPVTAGRALQALLAPRGTALLGFEPPTSNGRQALQAKLAKAAPLAGFVPRGMHLDPASSAFAIEWTLARRGTRTRPA